MRQTLLFALITLCLFGCKSFVDYTPSNDESKIIHNLFVAEVSIYLGGRYETDYDGINASISSCPGNPQYYDLNCDRTVDQNTIKMSAKFKNQNIELLRDSVTGLFSYSSKDFKSTWENNEKMGLEINFNYDSSGTTKTFNETFTLTKRERTESNFALH